MKKKEFCYVLIVAVMGVSLLLGFAVEVFGVDLGPAAWVAGWVSSPVALAIGFVFAMLFGKALQILIGTKLSFVHEIDVDRCCRNIVRQILHSNAVAQIKEGKFTKK